MRFFLQKFINKFFYRTIIKRQLNKVGRNFRLGYFSEINNPKYFSFGHNFYSGPFTIFSTNKYNLVEVGDYVIFGPKCNIFGGNHDFLYEGFMYNNKNTDHMSGVIKIENGVWVGANSTILSGADIGEGSIIAAMSLVNRKIPPFVIAGGVPVKIIKPRFTTLQQLSNTINVTNSKFSIDEVIEIHKSFGFYYQ